MNDFSEVMKYFPFEGTLEEVYELKSGNINKTFCLCFSKDGIRRKYTIQRINKNVFLNGDAVMQNIIGITEFIKKKFNQAGIDPSRRVLDFMMTRNGRYSYTDEEGYHWRVYRYIDHATAYNTAEDLLHFYEAGRAFGEFQRLLSDYHADTLIETIPDFHDTEKRYQALEDSIQKDAAGRRREVEAEIDFILRRREKLTCIVSLLNNRSLKKRVTHNDTKINNVLIDDETGKAICIIDLDTVMPGSSLYDFGDGIRFGASTASEDEPDTNRIRLDLEKFSVFSNGFLSETKFILPADEIALLPLGAEVMTGESIVRFLKDYLDGDVYFKLNYPKHNLVRTRAQIALLTDMERKENDMQHIIASATEKI